MSITLIFFQFLNWYNWFVIYSQNKMYAIYSQQEPWRLPSRQAEFDGTDSLRLDAHSDDQAVTGNQGYFED